MAKLLPLLALSLLVAVWALSNRSAESPELDPVSPAPAPAPAESAEDSPAPLVEDRPGEVAAMDHDRKAAALETGRQAMRSGAVLVRVSLGQGPAAVGQEVLLERTERRAVGEPAAAASTDAQGEALFEGLTPGEVRIWSPLGGEVKAGVVAGQVTRASLLLGGAVKVEGTVLAPDGVPVPSAQVWVLGHSQSWHDCMPAARCDGAGRFQVSGLTGGRFLGATAEGFGPSDLSVLRAPAEGLGAAQVELRLTAEGGALTGRVIQSDGRPAAGARVAVGESPEARYQRDGSVRPQWRARHTRTDAEGLFALHGLGPGPQPVHAQGEGAPILAAKVIIVAGETASLELCLLPNCEVTGIVRGGDGQPIGDATILALEAPFEDPFPDQGPTDHGSPFHRPATRSAPDGTYTLTGLSPGEAHLFAEKGTSEWGEGQFLGAVQCTVTVAPDAAVRWDPIIDRGPRIQGRVLFADGAPMANVFVSAKIDGGRGGDEISSYTDEHGAFEFIGLEHRPYAIFVQLSDEDKNGVPPCKLDVWPSEQEVLLTANDSVAAGPKGRARVKLVDSAGRLGDLGGDVGLVQFAYERGTSFAEADAGGVWRASLDPRRYYANVWLGNELIGYGSWFDVGPGQEVDFGEVHTLPACAVTVAVEGPRGSDEPLVVYATTGDGRARRFRRLAPDATEVTFDDLLPGPAKIEVKGKGFETQQIEVTLAAGQTPRELVRLQRSAK